MNKLDLDNLRVMIKINNTDEGRQVMIEQLEVILNELKEQEESFQRFLQHEQS